MARFTFIAMMSISRFFGIHKLCKLVGKLRPESVDHLFRNIMGKRVRQRKWGYGGMAAQNFGTQFENFEELPTDGAAQFGN